MGKPGDRDLCAEGRGSRCAEPVARPDRSGRGLHRADHARRSRRAVPQAVRGGAADREIRREAACTAV